MTAVQSSARRSHQGDRKQPSSRSTTKYRLLAATNFEFVAIGVFEKEGVVTRTVFLANLRPLKIFSTSLAHELRNAIYLVPCVRPKRDSRVIRTMAFVLVQTKEFQRPIATSSRKGMKIVTRTFVNESKLWQKLSVKVFRDFHVFHPEIDVIKATRFHFVIFNLMGFQFNFRNREGKGAAQSFARRAYKILIGAQWTAHPASF